MSRCARSGETRIPDRPGARRTRRIRGREAEELALIQHARGLELAQAREVSRTLLANPKQALDVLAREELGLNPDELGSAWRAAATSFLTFAAGATVPLIPFLAGFTGTRAVEAPAMLALFGVGLGLSLFTGRDDLRGALRMVLIGGGAGAASFSARFWGSSSAEAAGAAGVLKTPLPSPRWLA